MAPKEGVPDSAECWQKIRRKGFFFRWVALSGGRKKMKSPCSSCGRLSRSTRRALTPASGLAPSKD